MFKIPIHLECHHKTFGETKIKKLHWSFFRDHSTKKLWKGRGNFIFNSFSFPGWNYKCKEEKREKKKVENEIRKLCPTRLQQCPMVNCSTYYTSNFFIPIVRAQKSSNHGPLSMMRLVAPNLAQTNRNL